MPIVETKNRTITKAVTWRLVAVINSWAILSISLSQSNFMNAILMNITGFCAFYFFERIWAKINFGRYYEH
jgi:hypothetical protein